MTALASAIACVFLSTLPGPCPGATAPPVASAAQTQDGAAWLAVGCGREWVPTSPADVQFANEEEEAEVEDETSYAAPAGLDDAAGLSLLADLRRREFHGALAGRLLSAPDSLGLTPLRC